MDYFNINTQNYKYSYQQDYPKIIRNEIGDLTAIFLTLGGECDDENFIRNY